MFIVGLLSWWYGAGWRQRAAIIKERLASTIDYFSIDLLLKTLFAPYRQISAGSVRGPLGVKWRAFVDRTISRCIGAIIRTAVILMGCVAILFYSVIGLLVLMLWAVVPLTPIIGIAMAMIGWVPSWT
ncbi:MAG TPA: hypothetical protein VGE13_04360 [Candidatus Saccharimonadales bacterium]